MRKQWLIVAAAGLFAAAPLAAEAAATPFDGRWTIVAEAREGSCEEAYRLPIDVQDGAISYAGPHAVDARGQVNSAGRVTITLAHGGNVVRAQGSLDAQTGGGKWVSPGCTGAWSGQKTSS